MELEDPVSHPPSLASLHVNVGAILKAVYLFQLSDSSLFTYHFIDRQFYHLFCIFYVHREGSHDVTSFLMLGASAGESYPHI